jgi:(R)-2-hydroxyacyl-CoA dehydratese activating ATPase
MITAGVDVGTRFLKWCIVEDDKLLGYSCLELDGRFDLVYKDGMQIAIKMAEEKNSIKIKKRDIKKIIATGYGSHLVKKAAYSLSEGVCIARGTNTLNKNIRTVIDSGGLFLRIIIIDNNGFLEKEYVNEKCASGSGKFLEMIAAAVEIPFDEISEYAIKAEKPFVITNSCAVFAESDIISEVNKGRNREDVIASVINSIAGKVVTLLDSGEAKELIVFSGGLSKIDAYIDSIKKAYNKNMIFLDIDPQVIGAFGAGVLAQGSRMNLRRRKVQADG